MLDADGEWWMTDYYLWKKKGIISQGNDALNIQTRTHAWFAWSIDNKQSTRYT